MNRMKSTPAGTGANNGNSNASNDISVENQQQQILTRLRQGSATTFQLRTEIDIPHPAARVQELRERGYNIITHRGYDNMPNGKTRCVAKYVLLPGTYKGDAV